MGEKSGGGTQLTRELCAFLASCGGGARGSVGSGARVGGGGDFWGADAPWGRRRWGLRAGRAGEGGKGAGAGPRVRVGRVGWGGAGGARNAGGYCRWGAWAESA